MSGLGTRPGTSLLPLLKVKGKEEIFPVKKVPKVEFRGPEEQRLSWDVGLWLGIVKWGLKGLNIEKEMSSLSFMVEWAVGYVVSEHLFLQWVGGPPLWCIWKQRHSWRGWRWRPLSIDIMKAIWVPKHDLTHDIIVLESIFAYLTPKFTLFRLLDVSRRGNREIHDPERA